MREALLRMEFFETYYYANIVHNVLNNIMGFLRNLNNWHEDREAKLFLQPFPKYSVLHSFAEHIIEELMYETLDDVSIDAIKTNPRSELWVDRALKHHGIASPGFCEWLAQQNIALSNATDDHVYDYHADLRWTGELDILMTQLVNEVFYILFGNRTLLERLNVYIAGIVSRIQSSDLPEEDSKLMYKDGVLARKHIPEWAKHAVYFRDRGKCASCNTDLTGIVSVMSSEHYDHIVPLSEGGINDVTNLQLLCRNCNLKKGRRLLPTSNRYEAWYSSDT